VWPICHLLCYLHSQLFLESSHEVVHSAYAYIPNNCSSLPQAGDTRADIVGPIVSAENVPCIMGTDKRKIFRPKKHCTVGQQCWPVCHRELTISVDSVTECLGVTSSLSRGDVHVLFTNSVVQPYQAASQKKPHPPEILPNSAQSSFGSSLMRAVEKPSV